MRWACLGVIVVLSACGSSDSGDGEPAQAVGGGAPGSGGTAGAGGTVRSDAGAGGTVRSDAGAGGTVRSDAGAGGTVRSDAGAGGTVRPVDAGQSDVAVDVSDAEKTALFFDDFLGSSIDATKWTVMDRISDQANAEINCCVPPNVSVSGGFLNGVSKYEDHTCGDSQQLPTLLHYTSWHIQQKTAPFLYGTVEVRAKPPGGTGIWATIWMLGYQWQASQPATANIPGADWPNAGWCEIDIAEFWQNSRSQVNCTVHFNTPGGLHEQALPFDATSRFMVYRLDWSPGSLVWSVDAEDGVGYRTLRTVTGAGSVPDVPMYVVINAAIGGIGGGTPNPSTFPQTFLVDWVRVTE